MSIHGQLEDLTYLASQLENSDHFEIDVKTFIRIADRLRDDLYGLTSDPRILDLLDHIPELDLAPHRRTFLEQLLPKSGREMIGDHNVREKILEQVRKIAKTFHYIHSLLPDEGEDDFV